MDEVIYECITEYYGVHCKLYSSKMGPDSECMIARAVLILSISGPILYEKKKKND